MSLSVRKNHDYTVSVIDSRQREISFRDIQGSDLEFFDYLIGDSNNSTEARTLTLDGVVSILSELCTKELDFKSLPQRIIFEIFKLVKENVLCNYMSKYDWLRQCYSIQNGSFMQIQAMEQVPMSKFVVMAQIHNDAIEAMNKTQ